MLDWQKKVIARLTKEGRPALGEEYRAIYDEIENDALLFAELKALVSDSQLESRLYSMHVEIQEGLYRKGKPVPALREKALLMAAAGSKPGGDRWQMRFCGLENVWSAANYVDPEAAAPGIADAAREIVAEIPAGMPCIGCLTGLRIRALMDVGRWDEAEDLCESYIKGEQFTSQVTVHALLYWSLIGIHHQDTAGSAAALASARKMAKELGGAFNVDNRWFIEEVEVARRLRFDSPASAVRRFQDNPMKIPPHAMEAVSVSLRLARAFAEEGDAASSRAWAKPAAATARRRGMTRYEAEARLLIAEAAAAMGDAAVTRREAKRLPALLRAMKSRLFDDRAKALGASV